MANLSEPSHVIVISKNEMINQTIATAFSKEEDFKLLEKHIEPDSILKDIHDLIPDIVLLDFQYDQPDHILDLIDEIALKYPRIAIVVILSEEALGHSQQVIMAGARAFMLHPFSQIQLLTTLRRVHELQARNIKTPTGSTEVVLSPGRSTFVVFSPKGGVGCTTAAVNLSIALFQLTGEDVLLMDGKHLFGDVVVMLNLRTANSIADLIPHAGSIDESLVHQVVSNHASGIQVLPCPDSITIAQGIRPDDLYNVILGLQRVYPHIMVDSGSYLSENVVTYMDSASWVLLVLTPDLASLRDARLFLDISRSLSYPREKILLVLNKVGRKTDVRIADIEKVLRSKVFASIPDAEDLANTSVNEGIPIILKKPNHPISKAYKKFAKDLQALAPSPSLAKATGEGISDIMFKTSRLG